MKKYYISTVCFLCSILAFSQDGTLDQTFGLINQFPGFDFKTITSYGEYNNGKGNSISINSIGNIIIGATEEKRTSFSSPLVNSFGYHIASSNGTISNDNYSGSGFLEVCNSITTLSNGKSVMVGNRFFENNFINSTDILMQFNNSNGALDLSIHPVTGQKTINIGYFEKISTLKEFDNKLYGCGYVILTENQNPKLLIARFNLSGNLDSTFGTNGYITPNITNLNNGLDIFIQSDSKILIVGNGCVVARFLNDGTLDNSFGTNGISYMDGYSYDENKLRPRPYWPTKPINNVLPCLWQWNELKSVIQESGELIGLGHGKLGYDRRVIALTNPGLDNQYALTSTFFADFQLIRANESTPSHRHTPCAARFIFEGEGWTTVGNENQMQLGSSNKNS